MARDHEATKCLLAKVTPVHPGRRQRPIAAAATQGFAERLALFVTGVDRQRADELLAGLTSANHRHATSVAKEASGWDSATRQGRMAVAFGNHPRAADRLRQLMAEASPSLQLAVFRRLVPWQQSLFPKLAAVIRPSRPVAPAMEALADRLIREATRQSLGPDPFDSIFTQ